MTTARIKVDKRIKPLHPSKRKVFEPVIGEQYYVCYESHYARRCRLVSIDDARKPAGITVRVPMRKGRAIYEDILSLFIDEIGRTPEEAVQNKLV